MYTGEMFETDETETALAADGVGCDVRVLAAPWRDTVAAVLSEATLVMPEGKWMQLGGKQGVHSEELGRMLATMQVLQRSYPGANW